MQRPPRLPRTENIDYYDDKSLSRAHNENGYQSDLDTIACNISYVAMYTENDHIIECIEDALSIQKSKLGKDHPSVTRTLHSLALEYKARGRFDSAILLLKESLKLLEKRMVLYSVTLINEEDVRDDASRSVSSKGSSRSGSSKGSSRSGSSKGSSRSGSSKGSSVASSHDDPSSNKHTKLLQEKSVVYSCLGNIYKSRGMYKEATNCYIESLNVLVIAGHRGDSSRILLIMRILKRVEEQKQLQPRQWLSFYNETHEPNKKDGYIEKRAGPLMEIHPRKYAALVSRCSWSSEGQMSI